MSRDTTQYGEKYWCIKTDISEDGEIYLMADEARILPDGTLSLVRLAKNGGPEQVNLAISSGKWTAVFAAAVLDGRAVAVKHWKGEVVEDRR